MEPMDRERRTDVPTEPDERSTLLQMLGYVRATVHAKCAGLSQEDADRHPLATSPDMAVTGLVSHLRWSEAFWFDLVFAGRTDGWPWPGTDDDSALQMRAGHGRPLADLLEEYAGQAARTDALIAATDLETESAYPADATGRPVALRYVVLHMVEETARHNGHLDVLRELADGVTG